MEEHERRKLTRISCDAEAILTCGKVQLRGAVENLSLKGALIKVPPEIEVGRNVEVRILLTDPASDPGILLGAKVLRHVEAGIAVRFTGMYLDCFERLKEVVASGVGNKKKVVGEFLRYMSE